MADITREVSPLPDRAPEPVFSPDELVWTEAEREQMETYKKRYPTNDGAVMRGLWLAQEKFGWLPPEVIQLVAETLEVPYAQVYGVATFYTQYYKEKKGKYVLDVCTCFSCQVCGGYDMLHHLEEKLGIHAGETTEDGLFTINEAECLGACGSAPMLQITNGSYLHNLTTKKLDALIDGLRQGKRVPFVSVTLPQDEDEMDGNRRTDTKATDTYHTPPVAKTLK